MSWHGTAVVRAFAVAIVVGLALPAVAEEPAGVTLEIERVLKGGRDEIVGWASSAFDEVVGHVRALERLDGEARKKSRDGQGLPCVTSAFESASALRDSTSGAAASAEVMLDAGNAALATMELRRLSIAVAQARTLRAEAEKCAKGSGVQLGNSRTTLEGGAAADALTQVGGDYLGYAFDPSQVSPF